MELKIEEIVSVIEHSIDKSIKEKFEGQTKLIHASFDNIHDKFKYTDATLARIEDQTTKHNNRMTKLETAQSQQNLFCQGVQKEKEGYQNARQKTRGALSITRQRLIQTITLIIMALGLAVTAYGVVKNAQKLETVETIIK